MRNPGGYGVLLGPDGTQEFDTFTCCHCNSIVVVKPGAPASACGGWCARCAQPNCSAPGCNARCVPFEKKLKAAERRMALRAAVTGSW